MFLLVVLLFIFILLYILFIIDYFLNDRSKRSKAIIIAIPLAIVLGFVGWQVASANHYFIRSTDLSEQTVAGLRLNQIISDHQLSEIGTYQKNDQPDGFIYDFDDLWIKTDTVQRITSFSTSWGLEEIEEGDSINKVKTIYGDNYYTYKEMCLGEAYVFVDRDVDWEMTVWTQDEKVRYVWVSIM